MKIAINGFGRIGRLAFRKLFLEGKHEVVAINDLFDVKILAYFLEFDSAQGRFCPGDIHVKDNILLVKEHSIQIFAERDPEKLPWGALGVDVVIESTGFFCSKLLASKHLTAGAKKVVISAPATGDLPTVVFGINHQILKNSDHIISTASCTTNCAAPIAWVLEQEMGIKSGLLTTVHALTNNQSLLDLANNKILRGRAAIANIIPTTTGAAVAVTKVLPELQGKLNGLALRVPVITGSIIDFAFRLKRETNVAEVNQLFARYAKSQLSSVLDYARYPLASSDIIGASHGSIFDPSLTSVLGTGDAQIVKVFSWYDNEMSYVSQMVRTVNYLLEFLL